MNYLKEKLLSGWHLMRWVRLVIGLIALVQLIGTGETMFGIVAGILLFQVVTNTGCGGSGSCTLPAGSKLTRDTIEEPKESSVR